MVIHASQVDLAQGEDAQGRSFGYVHGDGGGYFFTWMPTLDATVDSLEVDTLAGDGGLSRREVAEMLRGLLSVTRAGMKMWKAAR